jgi:histidinol-phosphate aminotransferase
MNASGKRQLYQGLQEMGLRCVPTETNFVFLDVQRDCQEVFQALLKKGVIVRTGDIFGYPTFLRVTIGTTEMNHRFLTALKEVLNR